MATEWQRENKKSKIIGLLTTKQIRGLKGSSAVAQWQLEAMEVLLTAELARILKKEKDAS